MFSLPEFKNSRLLVLPLLLEIQIRNGSKSNRFCRKMEQMQSQVMEHFVTKIISSFSANVLASVLVEATAHRNLFAFSDFFSLSSLQQVLHSSLFSPHCLLLKVIVVDLWRELEKQEWLHNSLVFFYWFKAIAFTVIMLHFMASNLKLIIIIIIIRIIILVVIIINAVFSLGDFHCHFLR